MIQCRICFEEYETKEIQEQELISPCACSGGSQHVHRRCLDLWHKEPKTVYDRCTICNTKYEYEDTKLLTEVEFLTLLWIGISLIWYFVPVFFLVHGIRQDERYMWYLNTSTSDCIPWKIGMLIADVFVSMGLLVGLLIYLLSFGHFSPVFTLNGKGDAIDNPGDYTGRSYDGSFCYLIWFFVGLFVACGFLHCCEELYHCLEARRRMNRKIKDLTFNKT